MSDENDKIKESTEILLALFGKDPSAKWVDFNFWYWMNAWDCKGLTEDQIIEKWKSVSVFDGKDLPEHFIRYLKECIREENKGKKSKKRKNCKRVLEHKNRPRPE